MMTVVPGLFISPNVDSPFARGGGKGILTGEGERVLPSYIVLDKRDPH